MPTGSRQSVQTNTFRVDGGGIKVPRRNYWQTLLIVAQAIFGSGRQRYSYEAGKAGGTWADWGAVAGRPSGADIGNAPGGMTRPPGLGV
jgi:hypothetical protein